MIFRDHRPHLGIWMRPRRAYDADSHAYRSRQAKTNVLIVRRNDGGSRGPFDAARRFVVTQLPDGPTTILHVSSRVGCRLRATYTSVARISGAASVTNERGRRTTAQSWSVAGTLAGDEPVPPEPRRRREAHRRALPLGRLTALGHPQGFGSRDELALLWTTQRSRGYEAVLPPLLHQSGEPSWSLVQELHSVGNGHPWPSPPPAGMQHRRPCRDNPAPGLGESGRACRSAGLR